MNARITSPVTRLSHFLLWMLLICPTISGQPSTPSEYQVKAAFLFNFTQFVQWPESAFAQNQSIVIGILGKDPFGNTLSSMVADEHVNGRTVQVVRYEQLDDIKNCNILFIPLSERARIPAILDQLKNRNILTVGESEGFARSGGMIHLQNENNKIRLVINHEAARQENLDISVKLLKLSTIVSTDKNLLK